MGQKVHPVGFRLGVIRQADSKWYADKKQYPSLLLSDHKIRRYIKKHLGKGIISRIDIERSVNKVSVTLFTSRPGAVIGRGGKGIDELSKALQEIAAKYDKDARVHVNVSEVRQPELDAQLVAENIAQQLERRIAHRRAMRQSAARHLRMNGRGMKIICSGRLGGIEIARREMVMVGSIPLQTLRADIEYGKAEAFTTYGVIGVRVWVYKGEVISDKARRSAETAGMLAKPKEEEATKKKAPKEEKASEKEQAVTEIPDAKPEAVKDSLKKGDTPDAGT